MPYPRTGQGGEPNLTLPDAITGNPGDRAAPRVPLPAPALPVPGAAACAAARWSATRAARGVGPAPGDLPPPHRRTAGPHAQEHGWPVATSPGSAPCGSRPAVSPGRDAWPSRSPWWPHRGGQRVGKDTFVAYFANTNGLYTGDEVRILGVAVGTVDTIEPQPRHDQGDLLGRLASTRFPPMSEPRSCRRRWSARGRSSSCRRTPAVRNWLPEKPSRRTAPRCRSSGTTSVSSWRSSPTRCSRPLPAGQPAGRVHQHRRGQPARPGRHRARHRDQAVPGDFGAGRPQHRHLQHRAQPAVAGVGAVVQQRSAGRVQHQSRRRHHRAVQHPQRSAPTRRRVSTPR